MFAAHSRWVSEAQPEASLKPACSTRAAAQTWAPQLVLGTPLGGIWRPQDADLASLRESHEFRQCPD